MKKLKTEIKPKLRAEIAKIKTLLIQGDEARFKAGHLVAKIVADGAEKTYGKGCVATLATELRRDPRLLYRWAKVTKTWKLAEAKSWLVKGLSFSHLVEIVKDKKITTTKRANKLLQRAVDHNLSVRDLRAIIAPDGDAKVVKRFSPIKTVDAWRVVLPKIAKSNRGKAALRELRDEIDLVLKNGKTSPKSASKRTNGAREDKHQSPGSTVPDSSAARTP